MDAVWAEVTAQVQPAISPKSPIKCRSTSAVVFFQNDPHEGIITQMVRPDGKIRIVLSRTGYDRVMSNWHPTGEDAFLTIKEKCVGMDREVPAMSHKRSVDAGVTFIHQVYGLYRDEKEMSGLFRLSSSAWQAYAKRHQCVYKLWNADEVDALMFSVPIALDVYADARFAAQRADIGRFVILYVYGGLYADLDVFPNLEKFPLVPPWPLQAVSEVKPNKEAGTRVEDRCGRGHRG